MIKFAKTKMDKKHKTENNLQTHIWDEKYENKNIT